MKSQVLVTIGREHGSGGHSIARALSQQLGIGLYDKEVIEGTIALSGYSPEIVEKMDEKPINFFSSRRIGSYSNSLEANVAEKTFEFLHNCADKGESFVAVGRCAEQVLRGNPNLVRIFICGDRTQKLQRIMETRNVSESQAAEILREIDWRRKTYHNYYCDTKWGDARGYDLTINSSPLGLSGTTNILAAYVRAFQQLSPGFPT